MLEKLKKISIGLLVVFFIQYLSIFLVNIFSWTFPPSLIGMIILALLLYFNIISMELMRDSCSLLLNHMVLFFVPVTIGIVMYTDVISENILVLGVVIFFSTLITMLVTALIADYFVERKQRKAGNE